MLSPGVACSVDVIVCQLDASFFVGGAQNERRLHKRFVLRQSDKSENVRNVPGKVDKTQQYMGLNITYDVRLVLTNNS